MGGRAIAVVTPGTRVIDRVVAALLLVLMAIGCFALWLAVPAVVLLTLSRATKSANLHFVLGLFLVPLAMVAFGSLLIWMNRIYLQVTGIFARLEADDDEPVYIRGPLEVMLLGSFAIAVITFLIFTIFIGDPIPQNQVI